MTNRRADVVLIAIIAFECGLIWAVVLAICLSPR